METKVNAKMMLNYIWQIYHKGELQIKENVLYQGTTRVQQANGFLVHPAIWSLLIWMAIVLNIVSSVLTSNRPKHRT